MPWSKKTTIGVAAAGIGAAFAAQKLWSTSQIHNRNRAIQGCPNIVILGAGFGGMNVARELARLLPAEHHRRITLIDRNNYLLFTPMLTEVAGGELDPHHIVASPRRLSPRIRFEQAAVNDIDLAQKTVTLDGGMDKGASRTLKADHLVIALGSVPNHHGIPGIREHSLGIKTLAEAAAIRNRILSCLEQASREDDPAARRDLLTFIVGGGGYTGVETMAAINDLARSSTKDYRNLKSDDITTMVIEPGDRLMEELSPDLAEFGRRKLEERGVRVMLETKITSAAENYVEIEGGQRIPTRTLVWAGGITPNPLVGRLDCRRGHHGGIVVDETCTVPDHPGVWAIGDCVEVPNAGQKGTRAPTAQNATREGTHVARNIVEVLRGNAPQPFRYDPIGELALVGRHSGVAKLYGQHFSGFVAWAMWRAIYLSKMPGMAQRSRIATDWVLDLIYGREITEFPIGRATPSGTPAAPVSSLS